MIHYEFEVLSFPGGSRRFILTLCGDGTAVEWEMTRATAEQLVEDLRVGLRNLREGIVVGERVGGREILYDEPRRIDR